MILSDYAVMNHHDCVQVSFSLNGQNKDMVCLQVIGAAVDVLALLSYFKTIIISYRWFFNSKRKLRRNNDLLIVI